MKPRIRRRLATVLVNLEDLVAEIRNFEEDLPEEFQDPARLARADLQSVTRRLGNMLTLGDARTTRRAG